MTSTLLRREEIARRAKSLYEQRLRAMVESRDNLGKMIIMDVETGDYEIDESGIEAAHRLRVRHPQAHLFGLRIGYNVAESFGGAMERTIQK